jgi:2-polyprenyl-6-methoxyphenol hydroxylase-like FAD-dependent oxidoreductase
LIPSESGRRVTGVRVQERGEADRQTRTLDAELVVDASGRGSRGPAWLAELGYAKPEETVVDARVGYASRIYAQPAGQRDWRAVRVMPAAGGTRGGLLLPIEGRRWLVSVVGVAADYPPTDDTGLMEFMRTLDSSLLYEAVRDAEPQSPIFSYRATANRRVRYERLSRQPCNFLVTGDAACVFNPLYAQGITVAALAALALRKALRRGTGRQDVARVFQARLARTTNLPWTLAVGSDLQVPGTGRVPLTTRFVNGYVDRVLRAGTRHPVAHLEALAVFHMCHSPAALFRPAVVRAALRAPKPRAPQQLRTAVPVRTARESETSGGHSEDLPA